MRTPEKVFLTGAIVAVIWGGSLPVTARADEPASLQATLAEPLLAPEQPVKEMRAFIESRIITMPRYTSRDQWDQVAKQVRRDMLEQIVFRGTAAKWRDTKAGVEWLDTIAGGPGYQIRKFRYEVLPGMWMPALLYLPDRLEGLVPLAVNVNGHAKEGKAVHYKQLRCINLAKRGMLVLNLEWFGMGQLATPGFSHYRMNQLDLCGASGLAPFYLAIERALDIGLALEHADPRRVAVSGLSGGGWQTILISSLDERVTLANPVAGYGGFHSNIWFDDLGDSEQAPNDMALVADYTHLTALRAPRPTLLTYNAGDDCCFKSGHTLEPLLQAAQPIFALYGAEDKLRTHVNHVPGTHNFEQENREKFYAMIGDFFYSGDKQFVRGEIASEGELKTADELKVSLPDKNVDFHRLAESLLPPLPCDAALPTDKATATNWQRAKREQLLALLKVPTYDAVSTAEKISSMDAYQVTSRLFKCGTSWTIPAVEITATSPPPDKAAVLIADGGRATTAADIERLVAAGYRVIAADPLLWGESKVKAQDPDYLFPLFVAAVGERPLGIQAAQLVALVRWAQQTIPNHPVTIMTTGPRASLAALVAAAVEPATISGVEVSGAISSLKELIEQDTTVESMPELFAFGLLAEFDIRQIVALAAPSRVTFRLPTERARRELEPLAAWYALFDISFDPTK